MQSVIDGASNAKTGGVMRGFGGEGVWVNDEGAVKRGGGPSRVCSAAWWGTESGITVFFWGDGVEKYDLKPLVAVPK